MYKNLRMNPFLTGKKFNDIYIFFTFLSLVKNNHKSTFTNSIELYTFSYWIEYYSRDFIDMSIYSYKSVG